MGGQGHDFGSGMPPKLDKDAPGKSGRVIMIGSQTLLDRLEDWRRRQPRIPTKSDAVRQLVEQALDAADEQSEREAPVQYDPLYQKIWGEFVKGSAPITVREAMARWGYSEGHTRRVMDWMSDRQQPPVLRKRPGVSPYEWERI